MRNWLHNETVILTGASSGIGRELCKILILQYGAKVIGIGRNEQKMQTLVAELGDSASSFTYRLFDVGEREAWERFASDLQAQNVAPILLINNAGAFPAFQTALDSSVETLNRIINTNFLSTVYAVKSVSPLLCGKGKDKPAIVNVASSASLCTIVGTSAYTASKCALKGYTEALILEQRENMYVGIMYPGTTATDLFASDENTKNSALDKVAMPASKMAKKLARKILKKRKRAVLGWDAKLMNFCAKVMPVKGPALIAWVMRKSKSKVFKKVFKE